MVFHLDWDGHVHTGFCPHGSGEPSRMYIERAIELGFRKISLIEHFPLPPDLPQPPTLLPVTMEMDKVAPYLEDSLALRDEFSGQIDVLVGFEWDFLPDFTDWTRGQMDRFGPRVQDGILSIHFLKGMIIDEAAEIFMCQVLPKLGGTLEGGYREYYRTLMMLVRADLGEFKPRRIGHLNLIRRFQKIYPAPGEFRDELTEIVREASSRGMQLDMNMSGIRRKYNGEPYVPEWLIRKIASGELQFDCVFGSDAHRSHEVGLGLVEAKGMLGVGRY
ncbi:MAG: histidinol-phosphatase HisJ [bacterium]|nr:histidinol-phosphatase HisJ [bacterium]